MPENRTPELGQVYRSPSGRPMLYVRTEQLPNSAAPEHLFAETRDRTVFQRWVAEVPEVFELVIDVEGQQRANEHAALHWAAEHDRSILIGLLKKACGWLPPARARELRQEWTAAQP